MLRYQPGKGEDVSLRLTGPTIAVAGLSLILPTLTAKPVPSPAGLLAHLRVVNVADTKLVELATIFVFLLFIAWASSIYSTHHIPPSRWALYIGLATYIIGIGFTEAKERV